MKAKTLELIIGDLSNLARQVWGLNMLFDMLDALKLTNQTEKLEQLQSAMEQEGIDLERKDN